MSKTTQPTPERVAEYVKDGGDACPFCRSDQIEGGSFECSAGDAWQSVLCNKCGAEWIDNYTLLDISVEGGLVEIRPPAVQSSALDALHRLLAIVESEYEADSERDELASWKVAIDVGNAAIADAGKAVTP